MLSIKKIAIIGGGPAGAMTALSLSNRLSSSSADTIQITIYNNSPDNSERIGESLPPAATPVLRRQGLADILEQDIHLPCPGSLSCWNSSTPRHNDFMLDIIGKGYHLDRTQFEQQLLERAQRAGVVIHQGWRLKGITPESSKGFILDFSVQSSPDIALTADFVVDASGQSSALVRRLSVARNVFDTVMFLCASLKLPDHHDMLPHTLVEAVAEGWWYAARTPGNKMMVTFCTDADTMKARQWHQPDHWLSMLRKTDWIHRNIPASCFSRTDTLPDIHRRSAPSSILSAVAGDQWLAVGDAASSYDPITSAGITKALMQAEQAGKAIAEWINTGSTTALQNYQAQVFEDFNHYVTTRHQLYHSEQRYMDSPFWQRRVGLH